MYCSFYQKQYRATNLVADIKLRKSSKSSRPLGPNQSSRLLFLNSSGDDYENDILCFTRHNGYT